MTQNPKYKLIQNNASIKLKQVNLLKFDLPTTYSYEIFNCKCPKYDHPTFIEHVQVSQDKNTVAICFTNNRYKFREDQKLVGSFCLVQRIQDNQVYRISNIVFGVKFIKYMKWDVDTFGLDCITNGFPSIMTLQTYEYILMKQLNLIGSSQNTFVQEIEAQIECQDFAIRRVKLKIEITRQQNKLLTHLQIKQILSEHKGSGQKNSCTKKKNKKILKKILGTQN